MLHYPASRWVDADTSGSPPLIVALYYTASEATDLDQILTILGRILTCIAKITPKRVAYRIDISVERISGRNLGAFTPHHMAHYAPYEFDLSCLVSGDVSGLITENPSASIRPTNGRSAQETSRITCDPNLLITANCMASKVRRFLDGGAKILLGNVTRAHFSGKSRVAFDDTDVRDHSSYAVVAKSCLYNVSPHFSMVALDQSPGVKEDNVHLSLAHRAVLAPSQTSCLESSLISFAPLQARPGVPMLHTATAPEEPVTVFSRPRSQ